MAAPATTARLTPIGIKMDDGFSTQLAFARDADVSFWEKSVTPPGLDGGDAIETTTMLNTLWRTFSARQLVTLTPMSLVAAYDPDVYDQIRDLINQEDSITVHFPDGSTLDFWGFLKSFDPQEHVEGLPPECNIEIVATNYDPTNFVEAAPVMTEVAGS